MIWQNGHAQKDVDIPRAGLKVSEVCHAGESSGFIVSSRPTSVDLQLGGEAVGLVVCIKSVLRTLVLIHTRAQPLSCKAPKLPRRLLPHSRDRLSA